MLDKMNTSYPNIELVREIGTHVPFLDVLVSNNKGDLSTSLHILIKQINTMIYITVNIRNKNSFFRGVDIFSFC